MKILRITTVPISLHKLLQGQPQYMMQNGIEVILASSEGKEIPEVEKTTGLKVHILPLTRKISPSTDLRAVWQTYKLIKKEKPDIVHTHTPKAGVVGMLAAKLTGVPIRMHTVAGLPLMQATGFKRKILNAVERLTSWAATGIYPNSFALADFIKEQKLAPDKKIKVLAKGSSNGIDTTHFDPKCYKEAAIKRFKDKLGIQDNDFVFSFVGRLVGDKGINELVAAFKKQLISAPLDDLKNDDDKPEEPEIDNKSKLDDQSSNEVESSPSEADSRSLSGVDSRLLSGVEVTGRFDSAQRPIMNKQSSPSEADSRSLSGVEVTGQHQLKLLLVGSFEEFDPISRETKNEIQNNPHIITTGWVDDVRPYLAISDVFVFPSYREGMPNVVLQAGAMGLPQIVTDINGSNEIIIQNENGLIVPVKDTKALYNAMHELYTNHSLRNKLASNARERILHRFEQKVVWEALLEEYRSLLHIGG